MSDTPSAYPLSWPAGWPRTAPRQRGNYRTTLGSALNNLRGELRKLCGEKAAATLVLSSNVTLGVERPADPGVVAYFAWDQQQIAIPCDRWQAVEHNVQAIALTIEAMRAMERHGAKHMIRAMFQGFTALPAPGEDWRNALGEPSSLAEAEANYRARMRRAHPDAGGSDAEAARLNGAIARAREAFNGGGAR